ncbi:MAG: hypothetical protein GF416_02570 [Candidatus Altiarchaeales archaeon]|nr:hypothetical protein [Candidatus Altiarchaeales archaeon]MBD3416003.1 hypothetical protein [Candidatus Altiarchaeales archaeon]
MRVKLRGQGSLEFIMTYGWVLLVLLVVVVVMWQWGLFDIGASVDPGSFGFWGLVVAQGNEFILDESGSLQVSLLNNIGYNITLFNYSATIDGVYKQCEACTPLVIEPGENEVIQLDHFEWGRPSGKRFDAFLVLQYNDSRTGGEVYQSSGRIWGNAEL